MSNPAPAVFQSNPQVGPDIRPAPMDLHHNPHPRDLQESQLDFVTASWAHEVFEHNTTRQQLQQYLALYLKSERGLCGERTYCEYLGSIIEDLRTDMRKEKIKRLEAEEAHASLLRSNLEEYCGVNPPVKSAEKSSRC
jgi:hypothetical protein